DRLRSKQHTLSSLHHGDYRSFICTPTTERSSQQNRVGWMASTAAIENRLVSLWETPKTLYGWLATVDHKELGIRYLVTAFAFLVIGGVEALIMRLQLARSDLALLSPEA